jgi:hypothetical protein
MRPDFGGLRVRCVSLRAVYREKGNQVHLYIELFKAKDAWLQLSPEQRGAYVQQVGSTMQGVLDAGAELVGGGAAEPSTSHHAGYDFFAVWKLPDADVVRAFEDGIERDNWYDYFEQVNASGELADFESVARRVMEL